jgi:hypothetical protein
MFFGVNGSEKSEQVMQFWWEIKGNEMIATSIPISKFKFIIDESKKTPTIKFIFEDDLDRSTTTPFEELDINHFLDINLKFCVVRLSQQTLENEVYLPK